MLNQWHLSVGELPEIFIRSSQVMLPEPPQQLIAYCRIQCRIGRSLLRALIPQV